MRAGQPPPTWENMRLLRGPGAAGHHLVCVGGAPRGCWRSLHLRTRRSPGRSSLSCFGWIPSGTALSSPGCVCGEKDSVCVLGRRTSGRECRGGLSFVAIRVSKSQRTVKIGSQKVSRHLRRPVSPTGEHYAENLRLRAEGVSAKRHRGAAATDTARVRILLGNRAQRQRTRVAAKVAHNFTLKTKSGEVRWGSAASHPWEP